MQEYPIGAFLFWELPQSKYGDYEYYSFLQNYHERNARHNPKTNPSGSEKVMVVLDGQQRLTSLYLPRIPSISVVLSILHAAYQIQRA